MALEYAGVPQRSIYQSLAYNTPTSQYVGSVDFLSPVKELQSVRDKAELASGFVKPVDALDPDVKRRDDIHSWYKQKLQEVAEYENPHDQLRAAKKLGQVYADDMVQGELGAISKNYASEQDYLKRLNEFKDASQQTKSALLKIARDKYTKQGGIGEKNDLGAFSGYTSVDPNKEIDIQKVADEATKGIVADKIASGAWQEVTDPDGKKWIKNNTSNEYVTYEEAYDIARQGVISNPEFEGFAKQQFMIDTYGRDISEDKFNEYQEYLLQNPLDAVAKKYAFQKQERNQDMKFDRTPEWMAKKDAGLGEWAPKITISNSGTATANKVSIENAGNTISSLDAQINDLKNKIKKGEIDADQGAEKISQLNSTREGLNNMVSHYTNIYANSEEGKQFIDEEYNNYKKNHPEHSNITKDQYLDMVKNSTPEDINPFGFLGGGSEMQPTSSLQRVKREINKKVESYVEENPISSSVRVLTGSVKQDKDRRTYVDDFSDVLTEQVVNNGTNYTANSSMTTVADLRNEFPEGEGYKIKVSPASDREFGKVVYHMTVVDKNNKQVHAETISPIEQGSATAKQVELGKALMREAETLNTSTARNDQKQQGLETIADALFGQSLYESNIDSQIKLEDTDKGTTAPFKINDENGNQYTVRVQKSKTPDIVGNTKRPSGEGVNIRYRLVDDKGDVTFDSEEGNGFANLSDLKIALTKELHANTIK